MISLDSIIESIKDSLKADGEVGLNTVVKTSYSAYKIPNPLTKTYVVINPSKITVNDNDGLEVSWAKKMIRFKIGINIHVSESDNPSKLLQKFSQIITAFEYQNIYKIKESGCAALKADSDSNSIMLPCYIEFVTYE